MTGIERLRKLTDAIPDYVRVAQGGAAPSCEAPDARKGQEASGEVRVMEGATMTATFVPSSEFRKILDELSVPKAEYVVEDPITIEATTESGETMRYPTAVRERIVRCRDCFFAEDGGRLCNHFLDECDDGPALVEPDGFCAWGERRYRK